MMCYRDRIFCSFHEDCKDGKDCNRALTKEVEMDALRKELFISQFVDKPDCFEEKEK